MDVGKQFYYNPSLSEYPSPDGTPSHIVLFDGLLPVSVLYVAGFVWVWVGG